MTTVRQTVANLAQRLDAIETVPLEIRLSADESLAIAVLRVLDIKGAGETEFAAVMDILRFIGRRKWVAATNAGRGTSRPYDLNDAPKGIRS